VRDFSVLPHGQRHVRFMRALCSDFRRAAQRAGGGDGKRVVGCGAAHGKRFSSLPTAAQ